MAPKFRPQVPELAEELRRAAFITRRSANSILNEALRDWLDTKGRAIVDAYDEVIRIQDAHEGSEELP